MRSMQSWEPSQHSLLDTGKPRKTCVEVAGRINVNFNILLEQFNCALVG